MSTGEQQLQIQKLNDFSWIEQYSSNQEDMDFYKNKQIISHTIVLQCLYYFKQFAKIHQSKGKPLSDLKVGIIGVGHIGTLILKNIYSYGTQLYLATNKPERLIDYSSYLLNLEAIIAETNNQVIEQCHLVFLCVPPTLDGWIVSELRDSFQINKPMVISTISDCNIGKLQQLTTVKTNIFCRPKLNFRLIDQDSKNQNQIDLVNSSFFHFIPFDNNYNHVFVQILESFYNFFEEEPSKFTQLDQFPQEYIQIFFESQDSLKSASDFTKTTFRIYKQTLNSSLE